MKTIILFATVAALSACSPKAENVAAPANDVTAPETANDAMANDTAAAWTGFEPGTYAVTDAKGAKADITIGADGTYTGVDAAGKTESGTFVMKGAKGCFTAKGAAEMCWSNSAPGADGSWIGTGDDGSKATVTKKPA
jgi:hypothetical protein